MVIVVVRVLFILFGVAGILTRKRYLLQWRLARDRLPPKWRPSESLYMTIQFGSGVVSIAVGLAVILLTIAG